MTRWVREWDNAKSDLKDNYGNPYEGEQANAGKALSLLLKYAHCSKALLMFGQSMRWGGRGGFFFLSAQQNQHRDSVKEAITPFYRLSGLYACDETYHTVEFILGCVKEKISHFVIGPNDELFKILDVIREKTAVDYESLDAHAIIRHYREGYQIPIASEILEASLVIDDAIDPAMDVPTARFV